LPSSSFLYFLFGYLTRKAALTDYQDQKIVMLAILSPPSMRHTRSTEYLARSSRCPLYSLHPLFLCPPFSCGWAPNHPEGLSSAPSRPPVFLLSKAPPTPIVHSEGRVRCCDGLRLHGGHGRRCSSPHCLFLCSMVGINLPLPICIQIG
jgi:hypothetical protein